MGLGAGLLDRSSLWLVEDLPGEWGKCRELDSADSIPNYTDPPYVAIKLVDLQDFADRD